MPSLFFSLAGLSRHLDFLDPDREWERDGEFEEDLDLELEPVQLLPLPLTLRLVRLEEKHTFETKLSHG